MKKGFALLETIIVITFVTVSLLLLYGTFTSMLLNREKNIEYDDAANIYKMYYLKEYLLLNGMNDYLNVSDIRKISCDDFLVTSCHTLWDKFHLEHVYLVPYRIHDYNENNYASSFNNYWMLYRIMKIMITGSWENFSMKMSIVMLVLE